MNYIGAAVGLLLAAALSSARAGIVQTVPPMSSDGWYELGDMSRTADSLGYKAFTNLGYVAWGKLAAAGLPADAKIRFVGGVLLDELPTGHVYDFSQLKYLAYVKADVFPAGYRLTVPSGCWFRFRGANVTPDYAAGTFTLSANATEQDKGYLADIEMNGKMSGNDDGGNPPIHGHLTGKGQLTLTNIGHHQVIDGGLDFGGKLIASNQQNNDNFTISSPLAESHLGTWQTYMDGSSTQNLYYFPARGADDPPCTLVITNVTTGWGSTKFANGKLSNGVGLFVHSGNTVKIVQVNYKDLYLVADTTATKPPLDKGVGNVEIGLFGSSSSGSIHPTANINLKVGFHNDAARTYTVDYTGWTDTVNVCTLDLTPRTGWGWVKVKGRSPANLPRKIVGPPARTASLTNVLEDAEWTLPFDFGVTDPAEVNAARCEAMGVLSIPAAGTVVLTNATALAGVPPIEGDYPILTGTSGGEAFANWTVRLAGDWNGISVTPLVGPTGLVVRIAQTATTGGDLTVIRPWTNTVNRVVDNLRVRADWTLAAGTRVTVSNTNLVEFGCGENQDVTVTVASNATLATSSHTSHCWTCGGTGGRVRFVLKEKATVQTDAVLIPDTAALDDGPFDFITLGVGAVFQSHMLVTTNAGTVAVNFAGGELKRSNFNQRFFDCIHPDGRIVFRSVDGAPIALNLASQQAVLTPQRGSLELTGNGGVLLRGTGGNSRLTLATDCRSRVLWNPRGGVYAVDDVRLFLSGDEAMPLAKSISLNSATASVDFNGTSSEILSIQGPGILSNSAANVSTVRFGADGRDVRLGEVIPQQIRGRFAFEKVGDGKLIADRPFDGACTLAGGTLVVTGGTPDNPVSPTALTVAAGTAITVDGGALLVPDGAQLAVRVKCRNGGQVKIGSGGAWTGQPGLRVVVSGADSKPSSQPIGPVDVTTAWRSVGPGGGGYIQTVQPSIYSPDRFMVGCDVGGFYISEDAGRHYEMRNVGLHEMWVETIAEHPTDPDTLILGGYSLYKSTDRGRTWVEKRTGLPAPSTGSFACRIAKVVYDPDDAARVYAAVGFYRGVQGYDNQHLYVSADGGESWTEVVAEGQFPSGAYVLDLAVDPRNGKRLIASTAKGIYISTNGGTNWTVSCTGLPSHLRTRKLAMAKSDPDTLYVTLRQKSGEKPYAGGVYKSTDGGATWSEANNGLDRRTGTAGTSDMLCTSYGCLAVDPTDANVVYVGGCTYWTPGIWKSTDGGANWTRILVSGAVELDPQGWLPFDGSLDMSISTLAVSPLGNHPITFGTAFAVWRSDDGGHNWSQRYTDRQADGTFASAGLEVICGTQALPDPHRRGRVYLGYLDVGAFVTTNNGASLVRRSQPRDLSCYSLAASPTEPGLVWGTFGSETARCRIMVSRDGLGSWAPTIAEGKEPSWITATLSGLSCVSAEAPYRLACIAEGHGVAVSPDGGATWTLVSETAFPDAKSVSCLTAAEGVLYAGVKATDRRCGRLWTSADGGVSWTRVTDDALCLGNVRNLCVEGRRILLSVNSSYSSYLGQTRFGGCWLSEDAGATWRRISTANNIFDAVFAGKWIVMARANNDYFDRFNDTAAVWISRDGGQTWTSIRDASLHNPQIFDLAVDPFDPTVVWGMSHGNATFVRRLP